MTMFDYKSIAKEIACANKRMIINESDIWYTILFVDIWKIAKRFAFDEKKMYIGRQHVKQAQRAVKAKLRFYRSIKKSGLRYAGPIDKDIPLDDELLVSYYFSR